MILNYGLVGCSMLFDANHSFPDLEFSMTWFCLMGGL